MHCALCGEPLEVGGYKRIVVCSACASQIVVLEPRRLEMRRA